MESGDNFLLAVTKTRVIYGLPLLAMGGLAPNVIVAAYTWHLSLLQLELFFFSTKTWISLAPPFPPPHVRSMTNLACARLYHPRRTPTVFLACRCS